MRSQKSSDSVLDRLPPFPAAAVAVLQACAAETAGLNEIADAIAMEEVLATTVMGAANSTALGAVQPASNLVLAVWRLGSQAVRGLAVATVLKRSSGRVFQQAGLARAGLWRHNFAVAAASAGAAAAGPGVDPSGAHLAGLLHDVGKMLFAAELGAAYATCLQQAADTGAPLSEVEAELLGMDHAELGASAVANWGFSAGVVEAVAQHHKSRETAAPLTLAVIVGNHVAAAMGLVVGPHSEATCAADAENLELEVGRAFLAHAEAALTHELPRIEAVVEAVGA